MSRRNKNTVRRTWGWRRWISSAQQELWTERLTAAQAPPWVMTERPAGSRILLEVYTYEHAAVLSLHSQFGGSVRVVADREWLNPLPAPPLRIGKKLEIVHEKERNRSAVPRLHIPHGLAFGSGDHATTHMLLRALTCHGDWPQTAALDLGTGSGVLALTARLLGARKIVATDFDAEAIRTARQNEELNFSVPLIRWQCADVKRLRVQARYDLVLANLFSEILGQAAPQIAGCIASGGQLWLSGILRSQRDEVIAAYRRQRLHLTRTVSRGKWVLLQWRKPDNSGKRRDQSDGGTKKAV